MGKPIANSERLNERTKLITNSLVEAAQCDFTKIGPKQIKDYLSDETLGTIQKRDEATENEDWDTIKTLTV